MQPFMQTQRQPAQKALKIQLQGQLDGAAMREALDGLQAQLKDQPGPCCLIVDSLQMLGYDSDARSAFVSWIYAHRQQLSCVAVISNNKKWRSVIAVMSSMSQVRMRTFASVPESQSWTRAQTIAAR